jgi:hypothetical protein
MKNKRLMIDCRQMKRKQLVRCELKSSVKHLFVSDSENEICTSI